MKKLMISLAAVAVAAGVQAASIDWASQSDSNFKGYNGQKLATTMPVYLIDSAYLTQIEAAINNGTIGNVDKDGKFVTQGVLGQGTFTNTRGAITKHTVDGGCALVYDKGDTIYNFAQLIIDNKNGAEGETWYNISQAAPKAAYDPTKTEEFAATGLTFTYQMFANDVSQTGGWKLAAVPEPTSGLLLLLGVAGLALRRRRA